VTERVARLSYFFPAHNEEANVRELVAEALEALPALAEVFEIIVVNDGSRDATGAIADELTAANPGVVRAVHRQRGAAADAKRHRLPRAVAQPLEERPGIVITSPVGAVIETWSRRRKPSV